MSRPYPARSSDTPDPVAVDRLCDGDPPARFTIPERRAAVAELTRRGWSATEIGYRLGCSERTVVRYRTRPPRIYLRRRPPCGTYSAYRGHLRRREAPCESCRAAEPLIRPLRPCGSHAAHVRHVARGETPCGLCVDAERAYQRARKRAKRGRAVAA